MEIIIKEISEQRKQKDSLLALTIFEKELSQIECQLKKISRENNLEHKICNSVVEIFDKFKDKIDKEALFDRIIGFTDILLNLKLYFSSWILFLNQVFSFLGIPLELIEWNNVDNIRQHFFLIGLQSPLASKMCHILMALAIIKHGVNRKRDSTFCSEKCLQQTEESLNLLRIVSQIALLREDLCYQVFNSSVHIINICQDLISASKHKQAFESVVWAYESLNRCVPLNTWKYIYWKYTISITICTILYDIGKTDAALKFAERNLTSLLELKNDMASTENESDMDTIEKEFNILLFRRRLFVTEPITTATTTTTTKTDGKQGSHQDKDTARSEIELSLEKMFFGDKKTQFRCVVMTLVSDHKLLMNDSSCLELLNVGSQLAFEMGFEQSLAIGKLAFYYKKNDLLLKIVDVIVNREDYDSDDILRNDVDLLRRLQVVRSKISQEDVVQSLINLSHALSKSPQNVDFDADFIRHASLTLWQRFCDEFKVRHPLNSLTTNTKLFLSHELLSLLAPVIRGFELTKCHLTEPVLWANVVVFYLQNVINNCTNSERSGKDVNRVVDIAKSSLECVEESRSCWSRAKSEELNINSFLSDLHLELLDCFVQINILAGNKLEVEENLKNFSPGRIFVLIHSSKFSAIKDDLGEKCIQLMKKYESDLSKVKFSNEIIPPPILLKRSSKSMTFSMPSIDGGLRAKWYKVFGKLVTTSARSKVNNNDTALTGTGILIPIFENVFDVSFLVPYKFYSFAIGLYDQKYQLIGGKIGDTCLPIQASFTLPISTCWAHLCLILSSSGLQNASITAGANLWNYLNLNPQEIGYSSTLASHLLISSTICAAYHSSASQLTLPRSQQLQRIEWAERIRKLRIQLDNKIPSNLILQSSLMIFHLLTPFLQRSLYYPLISDLLNTCLLDIELIFSTLTQIDNLSSRYLNGLTTIISCISYYLFSSRCVTGNLSTEGDFIRAFNLVRAVVGKWNQEENQSNMLLDSLSAGYPVKGIVVEFKDVFSSGFIGLVAVWMRFFFNPGDGWNLSGIEDPIWVNSLFKVENRMEIARNFKVSQRFAEIVIPFLKLFVVQGMYSQVQKKSNLPIIQSKKKSDSYLSIQKRVKERVESRKIDSRLSMFETQPASEEVVVPVTVTDSRKISKFAPDVSSKEKKSVDTKRQSPLKQPVFEHAALKNLVQKKFRILKQRKILRRSAEADGPRLAQLHAVQGIAKLMSVVDNDANSIRKHQIKILYPVDDIGLLEIGGIVKPTYDEWRPDAKLTEERLDDVRVGCLYIRRALILSQRHRLWSLFLSTCSQLWNVSQVVLSRLRLYTNVISSEATKSEFWRPFYYAADCWLDEFNTLSAQKQLPIENRETLLTNLVMKTMEYLYLNEKYDRVMTIGLKFLAKTENNYVEQIYPLIIHCRLQSDRFRRTCDLPPGLECPLHLTSPQLLLEKYCSSMQSQTKYKSLLFHCRRLLILSLIQSPVHLPETKASTIKGCSFVYLPVISTKTTPSTAEYFCGKETLFQHSYHKNLTTISKTTVISAYEKTIEICIKVNKLEACFAMYELASFFAVFDKDIEKCIPLWTKCQANLLESTNIDQLIEDVVESKERETSMQLDVVDSCGGFWGCVLCGVVSCKLSMYSTNYETIIRNLLIATRSFKAIFNGYIGNPILDLDFALLRMNGEIPLVSGHCRWFCCEQQFLDALKWIIPKLIANNYYRQVLPLICLHLYFSQAFTVSACDAMQSHLWRLEALINLNLFAESIEVLCWLINEDNQRCLSNLITTDKLRPVVQCSAVFDKNQPPNHPLNWPAINVTLDHDKFLEMISRDVETGNKILLIKGLFLSSLFSCLGDCPEEVLVKDSTSTKTTESEQPLTIKQFHTRVSEDAEKLLKLIPGRILLQEPDLETLLQQHVKCQLTLARHLQNTSITFPAACLAYTSLIRITSHTNSNRITLSSWLQCRLLLVQCLIELKTCSTNSDCTFLDPGQTAVDGAAEADVIGFHEAKVAFLMQIATLRYLDGKDCKLVLKQAADSLANDQMLLNDSSRLLLIQLYITRGIDEFNNLSSIPQINDLGLVKDEFNIALELLTRELSHQGIDIKNKHISKTHPKLNLYSKYLELLVYALLGKALCKIISGALTPNVSFINLGVEMLRFAFTICQTQIKRSFWLEFCCLYNLANAKAAFLRPSKFRLLKNYSDALLCLLLEDVDCRLINRVSSQLADLINDMGDELNIKNLTNNQIISDAEKHKILFVFISTAVMASQSLKTRTKLLNEFRDEASSSLNPPSNVPRILTFDLLGPQLLNEEMTSVDVASFLSGKPQQGSFIDVVTRIDTVVEENLTWLKILEYAQHIENIHENWVKVQEKRFEFAAYDAPFFGLLPQMLYPRNAVVSRLSAVHAYLKKNIKKYEETALFQIQDVINDLVFKVIDEFEEQKSSIDKEVMKNVFNLNIGDLCFYWKTQPKANEIVEEVMFVYFSFVAVGGRICCGQLAVPPSGYVLAMEWLQMAMENLKTSWNLFSEMNLMECIEILLDIKITTVFLGTLAALQILENFLKNPFGCFRNSTFAQSIGTVFNSVVN